MKTRAATFLAIAIESIALPARAQAVGIPVAPPPVAPASATPGLTVPPTAAFPGAPVPWAPPPPASAQSPAVPAIAAPPDVRRSYAGRWGFEIGIAVSPASVRTWQYDSANVTNVAQVPVSGTAGMRAWLSDSVALMPALRFHVENPDASDNGKTSWLFAPSASLAFAIYKGRSTRLLLAPGLRFEYQKARSTSTYQDPTTGRTQSNIENIRIFGGALPASLLLEQRLVDRLALDVGASTDLLTVDSVKIDEGKSRLDIGGGIETTQLVASLILYTD